MESTDLKCFLQLLVIVGFVAFFLKLCFNCYQLESEHKFILQQKNQKLRDEKLTLLEDKLMEVQQKLTDLENNYKDKLKELEPMEKEKQFIETLKYAINETTDHVKKQAYLDEIINFKTPKN